MTTTATNDWRLTCRRRGRVARRLATRKFVVDSDGKLAEVLPNVKPVQHDDEVLAALADLGAATL
jgi:peroxiredoxin